MGWSGFGSRRGTSCVGPKGSYLSLHSKWYERDMHMAELHSHPSCPRTRLQQWPRHPAMRSCKETTSIPRRAAWQASFLDAVFRGITSYPAHNMPTCETQITRLCIRWLCSATGEPVPPQCVLKAPPCFCMGQSEAGPVGR